MYIAEQCSVAGAYMYMYMKCYVNFGPLELGHPFVPIDSIIVYDCACVRVRRIWLGVSIIIYGRILRMTKPIY